MITIFFDSMREWSWMDEWFDQQIINCWIDFHSAIQTFNHSL